VHLCSFQRNTARCPPHPYLLIKIECDLNLKLAQVDWSHGVLDTMEASAFYRQVLRTGIRYGPHFKMLVKKTIDGSAAVLRSALLRSKPNIYL
jgi:hypothetical protein